MFDIVIHIHKTGAEEMADLKAKLDEVKAVIAAEKAEVAEAIAELGAKIDNLKQIIEAGQATEDAIVGALDEIKVDVENIFSKEVAPAPEPTPEPTPEPAPE